MYSPIEGMNTNRNAATTPGAATGSVTFRNVWSLLAPRSVPASRSRRSMFSSAMKIGSTMNGTHA
jgi:hypothetical protein